MDPVTKYALELIEEQAAGYRRVLDRASYPNHRRGEVTLDADALAMPLESIAAKIRKRQEERDRSTIV